VNSSCNFSLRVFLPGGRVAFEYVLGRKTHIHLTTALAQTKRVDSPGVVRDLDTI
jgi:hypothetical protein